MVVFEIKGQPMGKQRPKFTRVGKYAKVYTPRETTNYEKMVAMSYYGYEYFGKEPLSIRIKAYYQIPKSYSFKKKMQCFDGVIRPTVKPDVDNVAKVILDGLSNGVAFDDDKQVVELIVEKYYSLEPRVLVSIARKESDKSA